MLENFVYNIICKNSQGLMLKEVVELVPPILGNTVAISKVVNALKLGKRITTFRAKDGKLKYKSSDEEKNEPMILRFKK